MDKLGSAITFATAAGIAAAAAKLLYDKRKKDKIKSLYTTKKEDTTSHILPDTTSDINDIIFAYGDKFKKG